MNFGITGGEQRVSGRQLRALLTAWHVRHPSRGTLYSTNTARVDFIPYQYRPVLALLRADKPRILIADEVGVGKTIEAGLIMKELQARSVLDSFLVLCPKALISERKWKEELRRFDEEIVHLDSELLAHALDEVAIYGRWPHQLRKAAIPYSILNERLVHGDKSGRYKRPGLAAVADSILFDLVIVDEAHHAREPGTWNHQAVKLFLKGANAAVLLSATPVQRDDLDLYHLLKLIRPDVFESQDDFRRLISPNVFLDRAIAVVRERKEGWIEAALENLNQALSTDWGTHVLIHDPRLIRVREYIDSGDASHVWVEIVRLLEQSKTLSTVMTRTRRREIGEFTKRKPMTIQVEFTHAETQVYASLLDFVHRIACMSGSGMPAHFLAATLARQASSCLRGLKPQIEGILERNLLRLGIDDLDDDLSIDQATSDLRTRSEELLRLIAELDESDNKFDALAELLGTEQDRGTKKFLLFTSFRHTISHLEAQLQKRNFRLGVIHGDIADSERRDLRRRFRLPQSNVDAIDILLSTEVGSEGLDFQFCDFLINYDVPWNPMRVEQRIGRVDRHGQMSEAVSIANFTVTGTIDDDIYQRCLWRLGLFERAVGATEEIFGTITTAIERVALDFTLTVEERQNHLGTIAAAQVEIEREADALEKAQGELVGVSVTPETAREIDTAQSPWCSPLMVGGLISEYLEIICPTRRHVFGTERVTTVVLDAEELQTISGDLAAVGNMSDHEPNLKAWVSGRSPRFKAALTPQLAIDNPEIALLAMTHPLIQAAAAAMDRRSPVEFSLRRRAQVGEPCGRFPIAAYGLTTSIDGTDTSSELRFTTLGACEQLSPDKMFDAYQLIDHDGVLSAIEREGLIVKVDQEYKAAIAQAKRSADADFRTRSATLSTHVERQLTKIRARQATADDASIQRMYASQVASKESKLQEQVEGLQDMVESTVVKCKIVALGVLEVVAA